MLTGITADPLLVTPGGNAIAWPAPTASLSAYKTSPSSPAINAGLDLSSLFAINTGTVDFYNSVLPAYNQRDIGAYEKPTIIVTALSETNAEKMKISIYPNPVSPGETLHFSGTEGAYLVELYSINGSLVLKQMLEGEEYHLPEGITTGIYIVRLSNNKGDISSEKIIVR